MTPLSKIASLFIIAVSAAGIIFLVISFGGKSKSLPVLGEPGHVAGNFSFTNQQGKTITEKEVTGKITVVEYFFTSCPGICRQMAAGLQRVYEKYGNDSRFLILSHTVDPERDSPLLLKAYADKLQVHNSNWQFLTGDKQELYNAARKEYLLSVEDNKAASIAEDFIHTQYVCLLDEERKIRGFYDATDPKSIDKLIEDVELLLKH